MEHLLENKDIITNRKIFYNFLGRLYMVEVDDDLFKQLKKMNLPENTGYKEMDEGYSLLKKYLRNHDPDPITDLAVDYARVFLGAGVYEGIVAHPYESVYTSPEHLIMQDARDEVLALYHSKGLDKSDSWDIPEDHIALEFAYMSYLCQETLDAIEKEDVTNVFKLLKEQKEFLEHHLLNWIPDFCKDIEKCSSTDFYNGIAKLTKGYLSMEKELLDKLMMKTPSMV